MPLKAGEGEYDHVLPDGLGGEATAENCMLLCRPCHRSKTKLDVARMAKADAVRNRHLGLTKSRNPMPGSRRSKWKKTFGNGTVPR